MVAKNDEVHRALKALLARRLLRREYAALVDGHPSARTGTIDAPIGRAPARPGADVDRQRRAREARTHFEIERLLPTAALLRVILETGRTHQIRVHLAAIGHPVCGDRQYGVAGRYGLERQFLHAQRLAFDHPVTGASDRRAARRCRRICGRRWTWPSGGSDPPEARRDRWPRAGGAEYDPLDRCVSRVGAKPSVADGFDPLGRRAATNGSISAQILARGPYVA